MGKTADVMRRIYYVEQKDYYVDERGIDHQIADGGSLPIIATSKTEAIRVARLFEKEYRVKYGYETTIDDEHYPKQEDYCLFAVRQEDKRHKTRREVKVYRTFTL